MKLQIPTQYSFLFKPRRYKVMFSGRAAGKSWAIAMSLMAMGLQKKLRILCTREFQNSITDSVHKLLSDMNDKYGFGYEITNNSIKHPMSGTEFMFYGLKTNITKIKSLEAVDICWVEEAETISERSLEVLIPTIRKEGSEIWLSFNPFDENDAAYKMFVTPYLEELVDTSLYADHDHYVLKTGYWDNPFLPDTIKLEIEKTKESDYRKYEHIYRGLPVGNDENCLINPEWFDAAIDAHVKLNIQPRGARVIGFDPADEGQDHKAAVRRYGMVVQQISDWGTGNLEEAVEIVYHMALDNNVNEIVYDGIGVGAGAKLKFNQFDPSDLITKNNFIGGAKPDYPHAKYKESETNRDMFRNKRAQYYWLLRDRFEATYRAVVHGEYIDPEELISIASDCDYIDDLKGEVTKIQRKRSSSSQLIQIESKNDMRKRGMKSPNIADALIYCFANGDHKKIAVKTIDIVFDDEW